MTNQGFSGSRGSYGSGPYGAGYGPGFGVAPPVPPAPNGIAVAGLVCAILGLGFLIPLLGWLAIPFVLLGLILSAVGFARARGGAARRGIALAGLIISILTLFAGVILNVVIYRNITAEWGVATPAAIAPSGPQAEAVIGDWEFEGTPWFRFTPDGIAENLTDGERFNWNGDGTFSNASVYQTWSVEGDTLTVTWITGNVFEYTRVP